MKSPAKKRLVILDSHAILHRSYHAVPNLTTSTGTPTGALFGLTSMLLRIGKDLAPDYLIACRDLPGGTFRHEQYAEYKGTRTKTDDALVSQLQTAPEIFTAFGVPVYSAAGFEADDCIGTIVKQLVGEDIDIVIATGDMDTLQLVSPQVSVYTFARGLSETITYNRDRVYERYGFGPEHVIDYKALRGDPSDNIPGIKGIGEKTATDLIVGFGSIENIYMILHADESVLTAQGIKPRIVQLLKDGETVARMSYELATISSDAPITATLPPIWRIQDHAQTIEQVCDMYEFTTLKNRIPQLVKSDVARSQDTFDMDSTPTEAVDPQILQEARLALWLLRSDFTNATVEDICIFTKCKTVADAHTHLLTELAKIPTLQYVYDTIEKPLIPIIARMNTDGVGVDTTYLNTLGQEYSTDIAALERQIHTLAGHKFSIASPKQLGVVLYDELQLVPAKQKKTATGARTTREDELIKMLDMHLIIPLVLQYRELTKLVSTYILKIPTLVGDDGRLHATFVSTGTTTGRMSSEDPNLQNIPIKTEHGRRIRNAFVAQDGYTLVSFDYSQIELRIAAAVSGDEKMISIFKSNGDIHTAVAMEVFNVSSADVTADMRRKAKVINFGILYGMGVNALRENLGVGTTREESAQFLDAYFKQFPRLREYIDNTKQSTRERGYTETLFGRRRYFPGITSMQPMVVAQAERMAINAPIQGTCADIVKLAMITIDATIAQTYTRDDVRLVMQVHDELVYEIKQTIVDTVAPTILNCMQHIGQDVLRGVPLTADGAQGSTWGTMHDIHI